MVLYGIIYTFGCITLLTAGIVQCMKIHERMTRDEIAHIFQSDVHNVPEYEVVTLQHNLHEHSSRRSLRLRLNAFGKEIDLYLQPSDGILAGQNTPVWLAFTKSNGKVQYKKLRKDMVQMGVKMFTSPTSLASIIAIEAKGVNASFEGILDDMTIRTLPERFKGTAMARNDIESYDTSDDLLETDNHVIIKSRPANHENESVEDLKNQIHKMQSQNNSKSAKSKRSMQDIVYPSILVTTDFAQTKTIKRYNAYYGEVMYQLAFWNAVDLRYRHVQDPKIRLRIVGIIIAIDRRATPYFHKYRRVNKNGKVFNVDDALTDMETYWVKMNERSRFPVKAYDIIVSVTDYRLIGPKLDGSMVKLLGLANIRSLCPSPDDTFFALAVIHDSKGFSGVLTATHELGHIMGLEHDEKTGDECDKSFRFMMQPNDNPDPNNLNWSPCSLKHLSYFLREDGITCVDEPAEFYPPGPAVPRFLPGYFIDSETQCRDRGYDMACKPSPRICARLECRRIRSLEIESRCVDTGPAAEGTTCRDGYKCLDGLCECLTYECIYNTIQ